MTVVEQQPFVLVDQLLDHLATPEGAMTIWKERLDPEIINKEDEGVRKVLRWTTEYITKYQEAPTKDMLHEEFGMEFFEPQTPVEWVIEKLRDQYKRNEGKKIIQEIGRRVLQDPDEAISIASSEFNRLKNLTTTRRYEMDTYEYDLTVESYRKTLTEGVDAGITFGWGQIDKDLVGLQKGNLVFIGARPKRFKSWLLLTSAHEAWLRGDEITFWSLELPLADITNRHLCMISGVSYGDFKKRKLTPTQWNDFKAAAEFAKERENKLHFLRPPVGERTVGVIEQVSKELGSKAVYIDQLSWINPNKAMDQKWRETEVIVDELKMMADNFPVYAAAQLNREAASLTEMADLSKFGLSDRIGQTADLLLGVYASKDMIQNRIIEFGTIDARDFLPVSYDMKINLGLNPKEPYIKCLGRKED